MARVSRLERTYDIGTLMNRTAGRNQLMGGIVCGINFACMREDMSIR